MILSGRKKIARRQLNKRYELYEVTRTTDGQGGGTETWSLKATIWGFVKAIKGTKAVEYGQIFESQPFIGIMAKDKDYDITNDMYIKDVVSNKEYKIESVQDHIDESYVELTLTVHE